jgi:anti-sigma B factor antagonist
MTENSSQSPIAEVRWSGRHAVAVARGDIDLSRSIEFQHQLLLLLDQHPEKMVVQLGDVPYMDSSGVASLVKVLSRARKSGTGLVLVGLTPRVRSLFQITRLDSVFQIHATEAEALK